MTDPASSQSTNRAARATSALVIGAVVLLLALLVFGVLKQGSDGRIDSSLADGKAAPAPSFKLSVLNAGSLPQNLGRALAPALADRTLGLDELRGTPFVLNFWASWCGPCRDEAPVLERGWRQHGSREVLFLGLDMQDASGEALAFLDEFNVTYPTIRDPTNDIAQSYGATGLPETYFVSAKGQVVGHVIGVVSDRQLDDGAVAARRGQLVGTLDGGARRQQR